MHIEILYLFLIYAVLGWVVEVAFHVLTIGKFINRGFLKGPYCPIYGFGMILILYVLSPFMKNLPVLFILSMAITTALELVGGWAMETFLHKRWWDYSKEPFNLKGYICLRFSIYWGLGALMAVEFLHPTVDWIYKISPRFVVNATVVIILGMMLIDFISTLNSILKLNKQLKEVEILENKICSLSDRMGEKITDVVELQLELDKKLEGIAKKHSRILKAFPDIRDKKHIGILDKVKGKLR